MGRAHRDAKTLHQMLAFIRAQPSIIERMLRHLETSSFVDLLVRIIQLDEQPGGEGVLDVRTTYPMESRPNHTNGSPYSGYHQKT